MQHMRINAVKGLLIERVAVRSPAGSPNTDGVDLARVTDAVIRNCHFETGEGVLSRHRKATSKWVRG